MSMSQELDYTVRCRATYKELLAIARERELTAVEADRMDALKIVKAVGAVMTDFASFVQIDNIRYNTPLMVDRTNASAAAEWGVEKYGLEHEDLFGSLMCADNAEDLLQ